MWYRRAAIDLLDGTNIQSIEELCIQQALCCPEKELAVFA
jgi:hypothetical protein